MHAPALLRAGGLPSHIFTSLGASTEARMTAVAAGQPMLLTRRSMDEAAALVAGLLKAFQREVSDTQLLLVPQVSERLVCVLWCAGTGYQTDTAEPQHELCMRSCVSVACIYRLCLTAPPLSHAHCGCRRWSASLHWTGACQHQLVRCCCVGPAAAGAGACCSLRHMLRV